MQVFQLMFKGKPKNPVDWQMYGMTRSEFENSMMNPLKQQLLQSNDQETKDEYYCIWCFKKPKEDEYK